MTNLKSFQIVQQNNHELPRGFLFLLTNYQNISKMKMDEESGEGNSHLLYDYMQYLSYESSLTSRGTLLFMSTEEQQLLSHVCHTDTLSLITKKIIPTPQEWEEFEILKKKFESGTPLPYLLGHKEFFTYQLKVTPAILIPREETETLVEKVLEIAQPNSLIIDVGTGSGCIAISLKKSDPSFTVIATDISTDALKIAQENAQNLEASILFFQGNLLEPIPSSVLKTSHEIIITANLPYIPDAEWDTLDISVQQEPRLALLGGTDGLDIFRILLDQIVKILPHKKITLLCEHTTTQHEPLIQEIKKRFNTGSVELIHDIYQNPRITIATISVP